MFSLISKASALVGPPGSRNGVHDEAQTIEFPNRVRTDLRTILERVHVSADELDVVGRDNESIRNRCSDIVGKVRNLSTLEDDLFGVFGQVDVLMRELERAKAEIIQKNAIFTMERDAHVELKMRFKATYDENETNRSDNEMLRSEVQRLSGVLTNAEARIDELERDIDAEAGKLVVSEDQRHDLETRLRYATDELQSVRKDYSSLDGLVSGLQSDLASERHRLALTEQNVRSLQASLQESQQHAARLKTDLDDVNLEWRNARQQIAVMDAELSKAQAEQTQLRALWQQEADAHASDVSALETQLEAVKSVSVVTEKLLSQTRDDLQSKLDELRQEERRSQDLTAKASLLEQKLQASEKANGELNARSAELEKSQELVLQRTKPLIKKVNEQETEARKFMQQIESLQARLALETERFDIERERADLTIKTLTENLEKEKAMKALAEGALDADRRERLQLHNALQSARNGQHQPQQQVEPA